MRHPLTLMPICHRCQSNYRGEEPYCEPCDEFVRLVRRENRAKRDRELSVPFPQCHRCGVRSPRGYWHCP